MFSTTHPKGDPAILATGLPAALGFMALGAAIALIARPAFQRIREARARNARATEAPVDDGALVERVRAALARTVPGAEIVDVRAREGRVILRGRSPRWWPATRSAKWWPRSRIAWPSSSVREVEATGAAHTPGGGIG